VRALFELSWGRARSFITSGKIAVDGETVTAPERRVRAGSEIVLHLNAPRPRQTDLDPARVVHVDTHVVVVDKPPGVSTVPHPEDPETATGTLDARVRAFLAKEERSRGGPRPALGIVHRLDKETSGLIVFTRTWLAKKSLSQQFREHSVDRVYLAIAHGDVPAQTMRSHLVEDRGDGLRGSVERNPRDKREGQPAITHVDVVERLRGATLVACRLETGRTHQIRIHLSEAGHPLLGERVYTRRWRGEPLPAPRLMLHAAELGFMHPATNREVSWASPLPHDVEETLSRLR
jgi:23S rRNA pseudouridine1911/1915/1917 synthase